MKEQIKKALDKMGLFLGVLGTVLGVLFFVVLLLSGAVLFGTELKHDQHRRLKKERILFLRDSLQVEIFKQELKNAKDSSDIYRHKQN